jgi:hypothetical protein
MFANGAAYKVIQLQNSHPLWNDVQKSLSDRRKDTTKTLILEELYAVEWVHKPFKWSWKREFKPNRRFFYHGTSCTTIQKILDDGFKIIPTPVSGRMLGDGIYATYHTDKALLYAPENYIFSVMVYAPQTLLIPPQISIQAAVIQAAVNTYHAVEVRTGAIVNAYTMQKHEICVYDTRRIIPRFISKVKIK